MQRLCTDRARAHTWVKDPLMFGIRCAECQLFVDTMAFQLNPKWPRERVIAEAEAARREVDQLQFPEAEADGA